MLADGRGTTAFRGVNVFCMVELGNVGGDSHRDQVERVAFHVNYRTV